MSGRERKRTRTGSRGVAGGGRRLFVALAPSDAAREGLARLSLMLPLPRRVAPEALHLTLAFLGPQPEAMLPDIDAALASVTAERFEVAPAGLGLFGGDRPRVVYAAIAPCPALAALQARVVSALRRAGCPPEARRFLPHVTLTRFAPGQADLPRLEQAIATLDGAAVPPWTVPGFSLMQSHLHPDGARYTALAEYPLG